MAFARAAGVTRSLLIYYGQVWKWRRMDEFYRQFVPPGALCFDVGAHVGNRIRSWLHLGARVVAIEPQPDFFRLLTRFYGRRPDVTLLECGLAEVAGEREMRVSSRAPTVSTFSTPWIDEVSANPRFGAVRWDRRETVKMDTLDGLIDRFGEPAFCKIDVEGFEEQVLAGLSRPLRALSFELIPIARGRAQACVDRLCALGDYEFRFSRGEAMRWTNDRWMSGEEMKRFTETIRADDKAGDIYARRTDG